MFAINATIHCVSVVQISLFVILTNKSYENWQKLFVVVVWFLLAYFDMSKILRTFKVKCVVLIITTITIRVM